MGNHNFGQRNCLVKEGTKNQFFSRCCSANQNMVVGSPEDRSKLCVDYYPLQGSSGHVSCSWHPQGKETHDNGKSGGESGRLNTGFLKNAKS